MYDSNPSRDSTWTRLAGIVKMNRLDLDLSQNDLDSTWTCVLMTRLSGWLTAIRLSHSDSVKRIMCTQPMSSITTSKVSVYIYALNLSICRICVDILAERPVRYLKKFLYHTGQITAPKNSHTGRGGTLMTTNEFV